MKGSLSIRKNPSFTDLSGSPSDNAALLAALEARLSVNNGLYILRANDITVLTSGAPDDVATIVLPSWLTRWAFCAWSSALNSIPPNRIFATSAAGTLAGASFVIYDGPGGTGNALCTYSGPSGTSDTAQPSITSAVQTAIRTTGTLYLRQTSNSANAGVVGLRVGILPLV